MVHWTTRRSRSKGHRMPADPRLESLRSLLDLSPLPMLVTELATGRVLAMNTQAELLFQTPESVALGRTTLELEFWNSSGSRALFLEMLREGNGSASAEVLVHRTERQCLLSSRILASEDGSEVLVSSLQDVTERRSAQEALRSSEDRLQRIFENSFDGIWDWNVAKGSAFFSPRYYSILGYENGEFPASLDLWRTMLHPDDLPGAEASLRRHFDDPTQPYHVEFRMRHKDGSWIWIEARGTVVERDPEGKPLRMVGTHSDITERRNAQEASLRSEKRLEQVIQSLTEGVMTLDASGTVRKANFRAHEILKVPDGVLVGVNILSGGWSFVHPRGGVVPPEEQPGWLTLQDGQARKDVELGVDAPDGSVVWISVSCSVLESDEDGGKGLLVSFSDITERKKMEEEAAREKTIVEAIFNSVPGLIYLYDGEGRLVRWNRKHELMTGYSASELAGMSLLDWYRDDPKSQDAVTAGVKSTIETGYGEAEADLQRKDGTTIPMFFSAAFLTIDGKPHFAGFGLDMTERRRQEDAQRRSEEMYRLLAENSLDMITRHDLEGRYLWASPSARTLLGLEPDELVGHEALEFIHPDDQALAKSSIGRIVTEHETSNVVYRLRHRSGSWIWVESMSRVVRNDSGRLVEIQVSTRDITKRRTAEERYRALFENLTIGFALHEIVRIESGTVVDYRFLEVNPAFEQLFQIPAHAFVGRLASEALHRSDPQQIAHLGEVALTGKPMRYELFVPTRDQWVEVHAYRSAPMQFAVLVSDITERKKQEAALRRSEADYRLLAENSTDVISRIAKDGTIAYISPSIEAARGWPPEHYIGGPATVGIHPDDLPGIRDAAMQARATGASIRPLYRSQHRDGTWGWVEASIIPLYDADGNPDGLIASSRDVSARIEAEQALKEREERLRLVLDATSDGVFDWDIPSGMVHFSSAIYTMLGYEVDEFPGHVDSWRALVHPDDFAATEALLEAHLADPAVRYRTEYRLRTKDGSWKWVIARGKVVERKDDGSALRMVGTQGDISDRKAAESALAESEERFRFLAENSLDVVLRLDPRGAILWASPSLGTVLDQDPVASIGLSSLANIHPDDRDRVAMELAATLQEPGQHKAIYRHITQGGKILWVESIGQALRDPASGEVESILVSTRDVTERIEAEEHRRLSEARLREVADMSQDMLSRHDIQGVCLWASPACRHILGIDPEAVVGRWAFDFIVPEDHASVQTALEQLIVSDNSRLQYRIRRTDGSILWVETIWSLTRDVDGNPFEIHCSTRDVGERKRQSELLEETQRLAHVGGWEFYFENGTTIWTREMKRLFGLDPDDPPLPLETLKSLLEPPSLQLYEEAFERLLRDGTPWDIMLRGRTIDGRLLLTRLTCDSERGADGKFIAIRGSMQDVTESELLRERLESASRLNQSILATTEALVVLLDLGGRIVRFNEACQRISGWSEVEMLGSSMIETLVPPTERGELSEAFETLIAHCQPSQFENHWSARDGRRFWISWVNSVILDEAGSPLYVLCTGIDMTAHRTTQIKLQETQERWKTLIETAPEAILILDVEEKRFTQANPAAEALFGRTEAELARLGPLELSPPAQFNGMSTLDAIDHYVGEALEGPAVTFDWIHLRPDAREILCQVNLSRIPSQGHPLLRASLVDITEKRKTESVMESLVQRTSSLFGQAFFDAMVRDLASLLEVRYAFVARIEPDGAHIRTLAFVADGNLAVSLSYPIAESPCADVLAHGLRLHSSSIRASYPGSLILEDLEAESYMGVPLYNVAHQPIGILAVVDSKPMTGGDLAKSILAIFAGRAQGEMERHEAELALRRLNSELEQRVQERTAELVAINRELESFSYSVSHDLRSPLRSINGFAQALFEDYAPSLDDEARGYLDRIRNASHRMSELIDDLLSLSHSSRKALRKTRVDLSAMALEILEMLRGSDPDRRIEYSVEPDLHAWADPVLLRAVLENLLGNSWKYTRRIELPRISVRTETAPPGRIAFAVADNGAGFDMAFAQKLFGTFQRLHGSDEFEGNGIGLATVKRILERHGGSIRGAGEIGKGATFVFELPIAPET